MGSSQRLSWRCTRSDSMKKRCLATLVTNQIDGYSKMNYKNKKHTCVISSKKFLQLDQYSFSHIDMVYHLWVTVIVSNKFLTIQIICLPFRYKWAEKVLFSHLHLQHNSYAFFGFKFRLIPKCPRFSYLSLQIIHILWQLKKRAPDMSAQSSRAIRMDDERKVQT